MDDGDPPRTAFISGPIDPGQGYFNQHYEPLISRAIAAGDSFVMGPAPGMDTMALEFLLKQGVDPSRITVYLAEFQAIPMAELKERIEGLGRKIKVEGVTTGLQDAGMTRDSDYDILRYMSIQEQNDFYSTYYFPRVSATEMNERRLGLPLHTYPELSKNEVPEEALRLLTQSEDVKGRLFPRWRRILRLA